jgi:hypothetical protein
LTPEEARAAAKKKLAEVGQGGNPAADKRRERGALPLFDVIDTFLRDHVEAKRKPSTAAWMRDTLERIVKPAFGARKLDKVTRQDVARLHSSMGDRPVQANRMLAILGSLYSWAGRAGYVPEGYNPCRGIERFPERARERFSDER